MSDAISEAVSFEQVIDVINASAQGNAAGCFGGTDTREPESMAGQYVWELVREGGYISDESIVAHLEYLADAGAEFDFSAALKNAISRKKQWRASRH